MRLTFVTTFPDTAWDVYAREGLESLKRFLPAGVRLCVGLDTPALADKVRAVLRPGDDLRIGMQPDQQEFVTRFAGRDHPTDYRLRALPFSHKIFTLYYFFNKEKSADYLVWWDADAIMQRAVSLDELVALMPGAGEAVSYLGRKDWDHSECGFMGFNMKHPGARAILDFMHYYYSSGTVFSLPQWHDSYVFDQARAGQPCRNISEGIAGNNVWAATALGGFSEHRKGPQAKQRGKALTDEELFSRS